MYFIMHVPMQRLIIPDLWIPLSGLLWSWYRIHCRRSLYFCAWMIRWYLNLTQNFKMFQNSSRIWIWLAMQGLILSCMILHLHIPATENVPPNMGRDFLLKQATMNRKRSGLFVTIWCEAAKGLKCWSIWLTSVTVPWRFCPIRTNIFLSTVQKAYRSFVLN